MSSKKLITLLLIVINLSYGQSDLNTILNGIFIKQDRISEELKDAIYDGYFSYLETNAKGETLKTITSKRKIYSKGYDKIKSEYLEMIVDGKILSQSEMAKQAKKTRADQKTYAPFDKAYRTQYEFSLIGEDNYQALKVWKIGFTPKRKGKGYVQGWAKIAQCDSSIVQMSFVPTELPFVLKYFNIVLNYDKFDKYWIPKQFRLTMELDVKVVFSLTHKFIVMQEDYSNYKFNNGLTDSFFK